MKRLLLWAVVLLCVSLSAQERGRVGINIEDPTAALDVNGTTRIRDIQLCNECTWVLVIDGEGNVRKRPVGAGGGIKYYGKVKKSDTRQYRSERCGSGKTSVDFDVVSDEVTGEAYSSTSQEEANSLAETDANNKLKKWFAVNGQRKANEANKCADRDPRITGFVCDPSNGNKKYNLYFASIYSSYASEKLNSKYYSMSDDDPDAVWCDKPEAGDTTYPVLPLGSVLNHFNKEEGTYWVCKDTGFGKLWKETYDLEECD